MASEISESNDDGLISVIIPTRNEPLIQLLVDQIHQFLSSTNHEIVVVDKSNIPPKLESARVVAQRSTGLGKAVLEGLAVVRGEWVAVMDGDCSHRPEDLREMIKLAFNSNLDFVLGSRYVKGGKNMDVPSRRITSKFFNSLARLIMGIKLSDPMSGLLVAKTRVFRDVSLSPIGYKINLELVCKALRLGLRGAEVPIVFTARRSGESKAGVHEGIRTLAYILAIRFREE